MLDTLSVVTGLLVFGIPDPGNGKGPPGSGDANAATTRGRNAVGADAGAEHIWGAYKADVGDAVPRE